MKSLIEIQKQSKRETRKNVAGLACLVLITAILALTVAGCGGAPPKVKGLYPGMTIDQARKAVGRYIYEEDETRAGGLVLKLSATPQEQREDELGEKTDNIERIMNSMSGKDKIWVNPEGTVTEITLSGTTASRFFGSGTTDVTSFVKQFRKAYGTPGFEREQRTEKGQDWFGNYVDELIDIYTCTGDDWMIQIHATDSSVDEVTYVTLTDAAGSFD